MTLTFAIVEGIVGLLAFAGTMAFQIKIGQDLTGWRS